jgi:hypothetical protein
LKPQACLLAAHLLYISQHIKIKVMKKLILAVSLFVANMVQANDIPSVQDDFIQISIPDFKEADQEMMIPLEEVVEIPVPDFSTADHEMTFHPETAFQISLPNFRQADLDMMHQ